MSAADRGPRMIPLLGVEAEGPLAIRVLGPDRAQLAALAAMGWPWKMPETWVEADDLLRELYADGD